MFFPDFLLGFLVVVVVVVVVTFLYMCFPVLALVVPGFPSRCGVNWPLSVNLNEFLQVHLG